MALFGLIFLVVALILIGVGGVLGVAVAVLTAILVALGVISSSLVVGLQRRSATAGIRTFVVLSGIAAGVPSGIFCAWLGSAVLDLYGLDARVLIYGGASGAAIGLLLALLVDFIFRCAARKLS